MKERGTHIDNPFADPKFDGGIFPGFQTDSEAATEEGVETKVIGDVEIVFNPNETVIGSHGVIDNGIKNPTC